jgi:hypothetical protein
MQRVRPLISPSGLPTAHISLTVARAVCATRAILNSPQGLTAAIPFATPSPPTARIPPAIEPQKRQATRQAAAASADQALVQVPSRLLPSRVLDPLGGLSSRNRTGTEEQRHNEAVLEAPDERLALSWSELGSRMKDVPSICPVSSTGSDGASNVTSIGIAIAVCVPQRGKAGGSQERQSRRNQELAKF